MSDEVPDVSGVSAFSQQAIDHYASEVLAHPDVIAFKARIPSATVSEGAERMVSLEWVFKILPVVIPIILSIVSGGGFTPAMIPILLKIIADLFGVPESEAQPMIERALAA